MNQTCLVQTLAQEEEIFTASLISEMTVLSRQSQVENSFNW